MTLSDREYQTLRDAAAAVIRVVGVETGGSNVQFALNRETGELVVIEMNPRVSRCSALASKATGYPIAKVATRLAIGYTLDEIPNDITGTTPASFEPTLDYVVVKAPRFAFEKFPGADGTLTTQMKSVGEAMGIGRNFCEALGKTLRSRELDGDRAQRRATSACPTWDRLDALLGRMRAGEIAGGARRRVRRSTPGSATSSRARSRSSTTPAARGLAGFDAEGMRQLEAARRLRLADRDADRLRARRTCARAARELGVRPVFKTVDSCGGEVEAETSLPLLELRPRSTSRSTTGRAARADPRLGPEPDRPGHRVRLLLRAGRARVPARGLRGDHGQLQPGDGLDRLRHVRPAVLRAAHGRGRARGRRARAAARRRRPVRRPDAAAAGAHAGRRRASPILGTDPAAIDLAEDRERFGGLLAELGLRAPEWAIASDADEAVAVAERIGYPVLVRPSLRARRPRDAHLLRRGDVRSVPVAPNSLVDRFVEDAIEIDVDAVSDGETC